jgi:O-antigen/teichoic acid export membrane protein
VFAIALAVAGAGVWALVGQTLSRGVVAFVILWRTSDFRPRWTFDRAAAREMTVFGGQSLLGSLQLQLRNHGAVFIIGALAGPVTLGYWTIAGRMVFVVVDVFSAVVGAVAHPVFARLQDTPERLGRALATSRGLSTLVLAPTLVLLALTSEQIVPAVFGEQWAPVTTVASILALAALLQSLTNFDRSALLATGHPGAELALTTAALVVQLGLALVFHSRLELLAIGTATALALLIPVRVLVLRRLVGVPLRTLSGAATTLLAAGIAAAAVVGGQALLGLDGVRYVAFAAALGGVVYTAAVLVVARPEALELVGIVRGLASRRPRATVS